MHIMLQFFNIIFTRWWCYFSIWISYISKTLTCIILHSKRQVHSCSYLLIIFIKLLANIPVVLLLHQKAKGSPFIIISLVVIDPSGDNLGWLAGGTTVRLLWWRFHLHGKVNPRSNNQCRSLIRLQRIYNFWCSMLVFTPFVYCFVTLRGTFMHFPELTY
jgi:hypothetical protein